MNRKMRWFLRLQTLLLSCLLIGMGVRHGVIDTERLGAVVGDHLTHLKQWLASLLS